MIPDNVMNISSKSSKSSNTNLRNHIKASVWTPPHGGIGAPNVVSIHGTLGFLYLYFSRENSEKYTFLQKLAINLFRILRAGVKNLISQGTPNTIKGT